MKLSTELEGKFLKHEDDKTSKIVERIEDADGVMFLCPKCYAENKGAIGTHVIICWFTGRVPDSLDPKPGRWNPAGNGLEDLTFEGPGAVSVKLTSGCQFHGFVRNGEAVEG